jgi:DNA-binding response OmpR family regulator
MNDKYDGEIAAALPRLKVMVVDDDPRYLELLEFTLEGEGYDVRIVQDPRRVQELAVSMQPDVIITDVTMPDLDGYALAVGLKSDPSTVGIPLVFVSARGYNMDRHAGLNIGAVEYLTKPFSIADLLTKINAIMLTNRPGVAIQ